jgi:hypothetical protein
MYKKIKYVESNPDLHIIRGIATKPPPDEFMVCRTRMDGAHQIIIDSDHSELIGHKDYCDFVNSMRYHAGSVELRLKKVNGEFPSMQILECSCGYTKSKGFHFNNETADKGNFNTNPKTTKGIKCDKS